MGTLYNQPNRNPLYVELKHINGFLDEVLQVATQHKLNVDQVLKAFEILELKRRNTLYQHNGDAHDEQMAGLGEEIKNLGNEIKSISEAILETQK